MEASDDSARDPWGRSMLNLLRRYWWLVAVPALIAGVIGFFATKASPVSAAAYASVASSGSGNAEDAAAAAATAADAAQTESVFTMAANRSGVSVDDLRRSVTVGLEAASNSISFKASAPTAAEAVTRANAVADAAVAVDGNRLQDRVSTMTKETSQVLRDQRLKQRAAENARIQQLGSTIGEAQAGAVSGSSRLMLLERASSARASSSPVLPITLACLIGGGLLGLAAAMIIGLRRGRVRDAEQLRTIFPSSQVLTRKELAPVLAAEAGHRDIVALTGVGVDSAHIDKLADSMKAGVRSSERPLVRNDDVSLIGRPSDSTGSRVNLMRVSPLPAVVRRVVADDRAVLFIAVKQGETRIKNIDAIARRLRENCYLVAI